VIDARHEAARDAVNAREAAHQRIAELTLAPLADLIDAGHDEQHASRAAAAQVASDLAARPEQLHDWLTEGSPSPHALIDAEGGARALAVQVTDHVIDSAPSIEERDLLIDLAACQHAIVALRDRSYADTARETSEL
jgi:hypothetical protein